MTWPPASDQPEYNSFFFFSPSLLPPSHSLLVSSYFIQGTRISDNFSVLLCLKLDKLHYNLLKGSLGKMPWMKLLHFFQTSSDWPSRSEHFFPLKWETFSLLVNCDSVMVSVIWNHPVNHHEYYMWYQSVLGQQAALTGALVWNWIVFNGFIVIIL